MTDILLAEDDPEIREWVAVALEQDACRVRAYANGISALAAYREKHPDLIVLDVMMPGKSGYDVLMEIRDRDKAVPVLMLTAKSSESDKVQGLGIGADDYMTKPFGVRELRARVAALLRRSGVNASGSRDVFKFGGLTVDMARRKLGEIELTGLEAAILKFLSAHPGEAVSREKMIAGIWGGNYDGTNRTLDNRILALRKKLGRFACLIETVYGTGYRYVDSCQRQPETGEDIA